MLFCFSANAEDAWRSFLPDDLIYKGAPICPDDTPFLYFRSGYEDRKKLDQVCENFQFNPETKEIFVETQIGEQRKGMIRPALSHIGYTYYGTYKNKHVIVGNVDDDYASGVFSTIGLISRDGDYIVNEETFMSGDRAYSGYITVDWVRDNILQFRFMKTYANLCDCLNAEELDNERYQKLIKGCDQLGFSANSSAFWNIVQIDLDDPKYEMHYQGIAMIRRSYYAQFSKSSLQYPENQCFNDLAIKYIDSDQEELNIDDSKEFAIQVLDCVIDMEKS